MILTVLKRDDDMQNQALWKDFVVSAVIPRNPPAEGDCQFLFHSFCYQSKCASEATRQLIDAYAER